MTCNVLDIELADKSVNRELEVFIDGKLQRYQFRAPKKVQTHKTSIWCTRKLNCIVWNRGCLDYSELPTFFLELHRVFTLQKFHRDARFLESSWMNDQGCPKKSGPC